MSFFLSIAQEACFEHARFCLFLRKQAFFLQKRERDAIMVAYKRQTGALLAGCSGSRNKEARAMANKVGALIREARTGAGLTQEQLAKKVDGVTASDISKAERGEKELTQTQLKLIAKATGVTQASLLNAAKSGTAAKKPSATAKKPAATAKKPAASTAKKPAAKKEEEIKLTAAEKKLLELYRAADKNTKDAALKVLKGEKQDLLSLLGGGDLLGSVTDLLGLGKK